MPPEKADVVVIGGGVVGCASAYYLAKAGVDVCLIERGPLGSGASKAGQCHIVLWEEPPINLALSKASKALYQNMSEELSVDIEYRDTGSLAIIEKESGIDDFAAMVGRLQAGGLDCEMLDAKGFIEREPNVAGDIAGGAWFPEDAQVNPMKTTLALAQGAREHGATIQTLTTVKGIELSTDGKSVQAVDTCQGKIATKNVVNAAGAWSAKIGEMVGLEIPVKPRKGHLVVVEPVPESVINCKVILAAGYMDSLKSESAVAVAANIQQAVNGNLVLGSSRQFVGFDTIVEPDVIRQMLSRCLRFFPKIAGVHAIRSWAGLRPYTPDMKPIIGPVDDINGFYNACGHEGIGITMGPITGKLISQLITGTDLQLPLDELTLSRFAR
jgi:glycine/D-amino acid oxidase-like deaminating enzyme